MRNIRQTSTYKKDLKALVKNTLFRKNAKVYEKYIEMIRTGQPLPREADDHFLAKTSPKHYQGCKEFHVAPNLCVIYRLTDEEVQLIRIGRHNDLELTEDI